MNKEERYKLIKTICERLNFRRAKMSEKATRFLSRLNNEGRSTGMDRETRAAIREHRNQRDFAPISTMMLK